MRAERVGWIPGVVICTGIPILAGHLGLGLAGAGELAVLAWRVKRPKAQQLGFT